MADIVQGDYRIYHNSENIYIHHLQYNKILVIEKFSSNLYETDLEILNKIVIYGPVKPQAILGIIKIGTNDFLVYIKVSQLVGLIEDAEIFRVKEAELIPLTDDTTATNLSTEVKSYVTGMKNLLQMGFFYSFHYDLTNTRQKQSKTKSSSIFDSADRKYFWNFNLYKKFINNEKKMVNKIWMVAMICGYVGIFEDNIGISSTTPISVCLISRRSVHNAGTRYNTRGIDDDGHVANYLETEQIIKYSNHILSYAQLRGSAPIFFQQTVMTAQTQITRIPEMTSSAFLKHIEEMQKDYQMIFLINLMNSSKPNEQVITQNLENQIKINALKSIRYYFFDFQSECKYDNYDKIESLITNLENVFNIFKFFCEDRNTGEIHKEQSGVMRTNCLDCLDRTNVIQTRISWKIFEMMMNFLNVDTGDLFTQDSFFGGKTYSPFIDTFKDLWAENGDHISVQYAGTGSTITTVTKNGKHGLLGFLQHGLVSMTRLYQGSIEDSFKQKCFELFLQKSHLDSYVSDPFLEEELKKQASKYTQHEELLIYFGSWNVGGKELKDGTMLFQWLLPLQTGKTPDVYVIGLQEIVNLNAKNIVLVSNASKVDFWRNILIKHLSEIDKYVYVKVLDLIGIFFIVFVKESLKENVRDIDQLIVRTGLLGTMGNKGSCMIRMNYLDTSIAISCGHLSAGTSNLNARLSEITDVLNKTFPNKNLKFKDHEVYFLFGDLNFRIEIDYATCRDMIKSGALATLAGFDQLNKSKSVSTSLIELDEGQLKFDPTYKYDIGTSDYDSSKKRVPSWCDRILFKKGSKVELIDYNRVDYTISDHKPIYALFKVTIDKVDHIVKNQILKEMKETVSMGVNVISGNEEFLSDISSHIDDDFFNSNKRFKKGENILQYRPQFNKVPQDMKGFPQQNKGFTEDECYKDTGEMQSQIPPDQEVNKGDNNKKDNKGGIMTNLFTYFKK